MNRLLRSMKKTDGHDMIADLLPVLYPRFITKVDVEGNQYVLLLQEGAAASDCDGSPFSVKDSPFSDRTGYEAFVNHVHLADGPFREELATVRKWGAAVAQHLSRELVREFPQRKFFVFLTINEEGMVLRFHQQWENEPPYYDTKESYDAEILCF